jgi:YidC/Oxa1 family membrane protein insertase
MHPEDKRNFIIFFLACLCAFFAYETFIRKPQIKALEAARQAQLAQLPVATAADTSPLTLDEALKQSPRVTINNPDLTGSISLKGGRIDNLLLKQYFETVEKQKPVTLLTPARTANALYLDFGWLSDGAAVPNADTVWQVKGVNTALSKDTPVTLTWSNAAGLTFERVYALDAEYMFTVTQTITNNSGQAVTLHPYSALTRQGLPLDFEKNAVMHEGPIGYFDGKLEETAYTDLDDKPRQDFTASKGWAGFTDKYWFSGLIAGDSAPASYRFIKAGTVEKPVYQIDMTQSPLVIAANTSATTVARSYVGPKKLDVLNGYKDALGIPRFDLVIDFGMFWFLTIPFFHILTWLGHSIGSFAIAILVFTVMLRLCVFPLANKSYRSFARMRKIQPRMVEIREIYGDDRVKLQAAIFELYKKENVNPMAGCLPLLIQIPIFFALYKVLYITIEMRHAPFWGWIADMSAPDPFSAFTLFGLIDWTPPSLLQIGAWPLIMGFTMFMQQRLNPPVQDPIQAKVLGFMPVMVTVLMAHFPAGLVIYWSWSNCLSCIQQYVLMRQEGVEVSFFRKSEADKKMEDIVAHGPSVHPVAEELSRDLEAIEGQIVEKTITPPKKPGQKGKK